MYNNNNQDPGRKGGIVRKYSSDSDATPEKPHGKKTIMDSQGILLDIQSKLAKVIEDQNTLKNSLNHKIEDRITNLQTNLSHKIEIECKKTHDDLLLEISQLKNQLITAENRWQAAMAATPTSHIYRRAGKSLSL